MCKIYFVWLISKESNKISKDDCFTLHVYTCVLLLQSFVTTVWQLCVVLIPMCVGLTLMNVVISSALTNTVPDTDTGEHLVYCGTCLRIALQIHIKKI